MKTSRTTSSADSPLRSALIDVLSAQWRSLGAPLQSPLPGIGLEVIDPEALIWCSLEFTQEQPRLAETVRAWAAVHRRKINRQRLNRLAKSRPDDPRANAWASLDAALRDSATRANWSKSGKAIGARDDRPATVHLRARDVLGNDGRSFLIVFLLGNGTETRLREVARHGLISYRALADIATDLERAKHLTIEHGHCRLTHRPLWSELLRFAHPNAAIVDWISVFGAWIELLRTLDKAQASDISIDRPVIRHAVEEAARTARASSLADPRDRHTALTHLLDALAQWG